MCIFTLGFTSNFIKPSFVGKWIIQQFFIILFQLKSPQSQDYLLSHPLNPIGFLEKLEYEYTI